MSLMFILRKDASPEASWRLIADLLRSAALSFMRCVGGGEREAAVVRGRELVWLLLVRWISFSGETVCGSSCYF